MLLRALSITCMLSLLPAQQQPRSPGGPDAPPAGQQRFFDLARTFHIDLPAGWRQLAPGELAPLRAAVAELPFDVGRNEPRMFYAIGPIDRWLAGAFDGVYLYVVEQGNEWLLDDDFAQHLQQMWADKGRSDGIQYTLTAIQRQEIGAPKHPAVVCERSSQPAAGRAQRSLDVSVPTGGRQLTLSFTCWMEDFPSWRPRFEQLAGTLAFARPARGVPTLGDRLWTPLITGGLVGLALALLYRRHRRRV